MNPNWSIKLSVTTTPETDQDAIDNVWSIALEERFAKLNHELLVIKWDNFGLSESPKSWNYNAISSSDQHDKVIQFYEEIESVKLY